MTSTLKGRREKAHKGESLRPDNKQAPPCYGIRCIWICPYISRHLLSLNPLLACCRRYSRGER
ncbi:hypothetical protein FV278_19660 [Escherichia coli]|nr:hypothetical protein FV278_19660 [Escherichia coli]